MRELRPLRPLNLSRRSVVSFIAGCFFGALVLFASMTQGKRLSDTQEAIQKRMTMKKPQVIEGEDPTDKFIAEHFDVKKEV